MSKSELHGIQQNMGSGERLTGRFRLYLFLSGLGGLVACGLLAGMCIWLTESGTLGILAPFPIVAFLLAIVLGAFSLAEIPMMVFTMRRLVIERQRNFGFVLGLNALFCFFAAVYGVPVILLTGNLGWGIVLCSLGLVRFLASLLFVIPPETVERDEEEQPAEFRG